MGCRCRLPASFSSFHRASLIVCQSFYTHVREETVQLLSLESRPLDPESSTLSQVSTSPTTPLALPHQRLNLHYDFFLIMVFCIRLSPPPPHSSRPAFLTFVVKFPLLRCYHWCQVPTLVNALTSAVHLIYSNHKIWESYLGDSPLWWLLCHATPSCNAYPFPAPPVLSPTTGSYAE